jgi:hypothetical protein
MANEIQVFEMTGLRPNVLGRPVKFLAKQTLSIGGAASTAFNPGTSYVTVVSTTSCVIEFGAAPDGSGSTFPIVAGQLYDFAANHTMKVIAVAGTATTPAFGNASIDALASGSGIIATASFTPAAAAYSANDIMSVAQTFTFTYAGSGLAIPATSLIRVLTAIVRIDQTALQASEAGYQLQGYSVTPPSAQADNDAWTLASADLPSYRGAISLGTPVDLGAACYVKSPNIDLDIRLATGVLFGELQTLAGFTATAVARQVTLYGIVL